VSYFKLVCIVVLFLCYLICFLKFVVREMNSEMVKSEMLVLTGREKADVNRI
jgi:hypothetical protein